VITITGSRDHDRPEQMIIITGIRSRRLASAHPQQFADAIHLAMGGPRLQPLSRTENLILTASAYFQPITRVEPQNGATLAGSRSLTARRGQARAYSC
jgi:hypothetical protein